MNSIPLRREFITLGQALKVAGIADTGGAAKQRVRAGEIFVNGELEQRPGRKLRAGDTLRDAQGQEWIVQG